MHLLKHARSLIWMISFVSVGCLQSPDETPVGGTPGAGTGGAGTTIAVEAASSKFQFAVQNTADIYSSTDANNTSVPAVGSPTIGTGSITTFTTPTTVYSSTTFFNPASATGSTTEVVTSATSLTATNRTGSVLLTQNVTSCTSTLSLTCTVDGTNAKQVNLAAITSASLAPLTTSLPLTVNGTAIAAPAQGYSVAYAGCNQCSANYVMNAVEMAESTNYVFVNSLYLQSGSSYNALFRINKADNSTAQIYQPFHGIISQLMSFNGSIYMSSRDNAATYSSFIKYDPSSNTFTNLSGSGSLLGNPRSFKLFNSKLYFVALDAGGRERLFRMGTSDSITRVFNICPSANDGAIKMIPTSLGLYTEIVDATSCGSSYDIVRINTNDSVTPLFTGSLASATSPLLGGVVVVGTKAYLSETSNAGAYRDNGDGSVSTIYDKAASGTIPLISTGAGIGTNAYFMEAASSANIYKVSDTGVVSRLPVPNLSNYAKETSFFNGQLFFTGKNSGGKTKLYKIDANDNLINVKIRSLSLDDDPQYLTQFDGELYFAANNTSGFQKLFKLKADGTLYQVTDFNAGASDQITGVFALSNGVYLNIANLKIVGVTKR